MWAVFRIVTATLLLTSGLVVQDAVAKEPSTQPKSVGTNISKSTFIYLADAERKILQPKGFGFLPAGTPFLAFDKTVRYKGATRRLILTATGLWGYIIDSSSNYWKPDRYDIFANPEVVVIRRRHEVKAPLSPDVTLSIWLTPSEVYRLVTESEDTFTIRLDQSKLHGLEAAISYEVEIPRNIAVLLNMDGIKFMESDVDYFKKNIVEGVVGVKKPCDSTQISTLKGGVGAGIDLDAWLVNIKVGGQFEKTQIEEIGPNYNVTRWYYTREKSGGIHRVTKKQDCKTKQLYYSYVNPENFEIEFAPEIDGQEDFSFDDATGRVVVSCSRQYLELAEYLLAREFSPDEIAFLISRLAKFKDTGDAARCVSS